MPNRRRKETSSTGDESDRSERPFNLIAASREQGPGGIAHETGELHRLLVESVQDYAIFALDPQGYILSWNPGAERFKGYTTDEIIGKHFSIFYPQERIATGFPEFELREAARTGRFEDEGWRIRKDGTRFWASVVITALRDSTGTLVGYAKVTRDLTERRAAEEALRLSEERFRLLVQGVRDYAIFMLDPTGHVATWNEGAQRIKQYSADEIIGKHFSIFYPPERIAEKFPQHELKEAERTGHFEDEGWRIRKDGTRFWANVVITALRDSDGHLIGFSKVTRDLTERKAAEERAIDDARRVASQEAARVAADASRERIERLQQLTALLAAAHTIAEITKIIFTEGFRTFGVDAGALAAIDASREFVQLLGDTGYEHLPGRFRRINRGERMPINTVLESGNALVFGSRAERDAQYPAISEVLAPYESTVVIPLGSRGRLIGALAMHRREAGAPNEDTLAFMQSFAQQCGQALERAQLYEAEQSARRDAEEARARADEANRAKSEFLAAMSHELRTPLNAIGGYAELIDLGVRGPVTPNQHEDLRRIQRSQQHLLGIINDLLNFSRIDAGQIDYDFADVPLDEIFDAVVQMIAPQAAAKSIQFEARACGPNVIVFVDRAKTEQILLNLLSNAVKFTAAGGRVTLRCGRVEERDVTVEVADSGSGIAPDQLERIFEPFVQVGRSLTSTREGAGLGLAISRELARAMGGEISVTSSVGVGSTFTLKLPRSISGADAPSPAGGA
jgi:PAS domain S-box-containing protein